MCENIEIGVAENNGIYSTTIEPTTTDDGGYTPPANPAPDAGTTTEDDGGYTPPTDPTPDAGTTTNDDGVHSDSENPGINVNGSKKPTTEPEEDDDGVYDDPENPSGDMNDSSNTSTECDVDITVISCSHIEWKRSSAIMGDDMRNIISEDGTFIVKTTTTAKAFGDAWSTTKKYLIIHTHGSGMGLSDQTENGLTPSIITLDELKSLKPNTEIDFVMITACHAADDNDCNDNVASCLSRLISPCGIVIANRHTVSSYKNPEDVEELSFWGISESNEKIKGWVAYQNGCIIKTEDAFPIELTIAEAYNQYICITS